MLKNETHEERGRGLSKRLEDIKNRYMEFEYDFNLRKEDIEWLIEQAERVQEYDRELISLEDNKHYVSEMLAKNKRFREALEFYADEETYESLEVQIGAVTKEGYKISKYKYVPIINTDKGEKARKALEGAK